MGQKQLFWSITSCCIWISRGRETYYSFWHLLQEQEDMSYNYYFSIISFFGGGILDWRGTRASFFEMYIPNLFTSFFFPLLDIYGAFTFLLFLGFITTGLFLFLLDTMDGKDERTRTDGDMSHRSNTFLSFLLQND
ncbi:hypothetical protein B0T21DRAFT_364202 [Apiosordaria backusii]|uniref:Uncharacterized protein n=1 Tax=Apiosordaria backusii TaxID=314023 RepID=A0AA40BMK1_9PEZI|nr:hypothetical protein B0T21DRAFT_364202 [Apiosordaria backusii]